jgi:hypothetical protein
MRLPCLCVSPKPQLLNAEINLYECFIPYIYLQMPEVQTGRKTCDRVLYGFEVNDDNDSNDHSVQNLLSSCLLSKT